MARRDTRDAHPAHIGLYSHWAWAWPMNRRILYNRAACDTDGMPFDPERFVIRWDKTKKGWEGDVPDGGWPPNSKHAFIMRRGGRARIFGLSMVDGPLPEHYEPWESPIKNPLQDQDVDPGLWDLELKAKGDPNAYPLVGTTYRISEHWQTGAMTRNVPWLAEMQPDMFVEISPELAKERSIKSGEQVIVESARGSIRAVAMVTPRLRPFLINGQVIHEVGMPWHWGYKGLVTGDSANVLTPAVGDPNAMIPETKAFLCNIRKV
jgi:anaerobic selenocysteine-containing dehydrogenase